MYFWKVDDLVNEFKAKSVTQKEQFKYYLLSSLFIVVITDPFVYIGIQYNIYNFLATITSCFITLCGLYYCYSINSKGDNIDFLPRVLCLGLPVIVRVTCVFLPIIILLTFLKGSLGTSFVSNVNSAEVMEETLLDFIVYRIFEITYFFYLSKAIKKVALC